MKKKKKPQTESNLYIVMQRNDNGDCFELPFNRAQLNKEFGLSTRIYDYEFYIKKLEEKYDALYFMFITKEKLNKLEENYENQN